MRLCAVVPAAGRGTRLGAGVPKLLAALGDGATVWSVLGRKLLAVADHLCLIVSPDGLGPIGEVVTRDGLGDRVSLIVQPTPTGMGDAIFRAASVWSAASAILIVWGDQVFVSPRTLREACTAHHDNPATIVLPLIQTPRPYVEYCFDRRGGLAAIKQSREGDECSPHGYADVGTFVLSVEGLRERWAEYLAAGGRGAHTAEINFLPFLPWLAARGWQVRRLTVADVREARGINTPDDLAFFRALIAAHGGLKEGYLR